MVQELEEEELVGLGLLLADVEKDVEEDDVHGQGDEEGLDDGEGDVRRGVVCHDALES